MIRLTLLALSLAACGAKDGPAPAPTPTPAPTPAPAPTPTPGADALPLFAAHVDTTRFAQYGEITFFVDAWERATDRAIPLTSEGLSVAIDGVPVPGRFTVGSARSTHQNLGLAIVLALGAHFDEATLAATVAALKAIAPSLGSETRVSLHTFDGDGLHEVLTTSHGGDALGGLVDLKRSADVLPPMTYKSVLRVLERLKDQDADWPRDSHLLLIGDGHDAMPERARKKASEHVIETATGMFVPTRIDVLVLKDVAGAPAFEGTTDELVALAAATRGVDRHASVAGGGAAIGPALSAYIDEIRGQHVILFVPDSYPGTATPVRIDFAARTPDGRAGAFQLTGIRVPERKIEE